MKIPKYVTPTAYRAMRDLGVTCPHEIDRVPLARYFAIEGFRAADFASLARWVRSHARTWKFEELDKAGELRLSKRDAALVRRALRACQRKFERTPVNLAGLPSVHRNDAYDRCIGKAAPFGRNDTAGPRPASGKSFFYSR